MDNLQLQSLITTNLILNSTSMKSIIGSEFLNSETTIAKKLGGSYLDNKLKVSNSLSIQLNLDSIAQIKSSDSNLDTADFKTFSSDLDFSSNIYNNSLDKISSSSNENSDVICQICFGDFTDIQEKESISSSDTQNECVKIICGHKFCRKCWEM